MLLSLCHSDEKLPPTGSPRTTEASLSQLWRPACPGSRHRYWGLTRAALCFQDGASGRVPRGRRLCPPRGYGEGGLALELLPNALVPEEVRGSVRQTRALPALCPTTAMLLQRTAPHVPPPLALPCPSASESPPGPVPTFSLSLTLPPPACSRSLCFMRGGQEGRDLGCPSLSSGPRFHHLGCAKNGG